jgi:outer membrane protein TolC
MKRLTYVLLIALTSAPQAQQALHAQQAQQPAPQNASPVAEGATLTNAVTLTNGATLTTGDLESLLAARPVVNETLTTDRAVELALRDSPMIRGAAEEVEAALGRLNAARAERRPFVSANAFATGGTLSNIVGTPAIAMMPGPLVNAPRGLFFDGNLSLMVPLYTSGRLQALVRQASALHGASQAQLEGQRQEVALLTRTAFREVQARRALVDVQRDRLRENEEQLRLDRIRAQEGRIPPFFVLRQEAEVAAAQQELTNAQRDVELSLLQLKTILGINPASNVEVTGGLEYQPSADFITRLSSVGTGSTGRDSTAPGRTSSGTALDSTAAGTTAAGTTTPAIPTPSTGSTTPAPGVIAPSAPVTGALVPGLRTPGTSKATGLPAALGGLLRAAERGRPELRAAGLRITGAELETAAIGRAYRPQVNAFVMGDVMKMRGMGATGGTTFGLAASIPIFTGGRRSAAVQTAAAERRRLQQERERIALEVAQGVESAYLNLRAAEQNIGTAQAALRAAQEDYRVARIRYESGRAVLVEVLDALAARTRAESNVVQALFAHNVARDQLLRAVGSDIPNPPIPPEG